MAELDVFEFKLNAFISTNMQIFIRCLIKTKKQRYVSYVAAWNLILPRMYRCKIGPIQNLEIMDRNSRSRFKKWAIFRNVKVYKL